MTNTQIQLKTDRITKIPIQNYEKDFMFIINHQEYKTTKLISQLLSPVICKMNLDDATNNTIEIETKNEGNFEKILNLINFEQISIEDNEILFIKEILELLGLPLNDFINHSSEEEINNENIISKLKLHEKYETIYPNLLEEDIEYISKHFYEIYETHKEEFETLLPTTIERIISNESLKIQNEDQLFNFINELCIRQKENENENYSRFYSYVIFSNLSSESMQTFINNFDYNEIDHETWTSLSNRLTKPILNQNENENAERRRRYENTKIEKENKKEKSKKNCAEKFFSLLV